MLKEHQKYFFIGLLLLTIINGLQAYFTPIVDDEAYYWVWSRKLDFGYFDHPPMIAWFIKVGYSIIPNTLGVRLLPIIANAIAFYLAYRITLPKNVKELQLFASIFLSLLVMQIFGFIATPDAPLLFFLMFYLWVLKRFIKSTGLINTVMLSIAMASLLYSKYHGVLVIIFTLTPLFFKYYKKPSFYIAILLGFILFLPQTIWLFKHDFSPIKYHFFERNKDEHWDFIRPIKYLLILLLGASPLLTIYYWKSIFSFKSKYDLKKSIWFLAIGSAVFFFFSSLKDNIQPQWLLISFVAMAFILYDYLKFTQNTKTVNLLALFTLLIVFVLRVYVVLPSSPLNNSKTFAKNAKTYNKGIAVFEKYQEASLYQFYYPNDTVAVYRTLGNRKSQFDLWNNEEPLNAKTITYFSQWNKSNVSFEGLKNKTYYAKTIQHFRGAHLLAIQADSILKAKTNSFINTTITIKNNHNRKIVLGDEIKLGIYYYEKIQYEVKYSSLIELPNITLQPNEEKSIKISFKNSPNQGVFNAYFGISPKGISPKYQSNQLKIIVE